MSNLSNFRAVISLWPTINSFGKDLGVPDDHAHQMKHRNSIPSKYWMKVVDAAHERGHRVTYEMLATIAANDTAGNGHKPKPSKRKRQ